MLPIQNRNFANQFHFQLYIPLVSHAEESLYLLALMHLIQQYYFFWKNRFHYLYSAINSHLRIVNG